MNYKEHIIKVSNEFKSLSEFPIQIDEEAAVSAYEAENENESIAIKALSILGGFLASIAFIGFILISNLYESNPLMFILGLSLIIGSIVISQSSNQIFIKSACVSLFIIGLLLLGIACNGFGASNSSLSLIILSVGIISMFTAASYPIIFLSVFTVNVCILVFLESMYLDSFISLYISLLALTLASVYMKEERLITLEPYFSKRYNPIKSSLTFSFIMIFLAICIKKISIFNIDNEWLISVVLIPIILFVVSKVLELLEIEKLKYKIGIYVITGISLTLTATFPAISGAILLILLSFMTNYKTGFTLGVLSFVYFIIQFYYDLSYSLLTKSILLFVSGVAFIALYFFTHNKIAHDKEI